MTLKSAVVKDYMTQSLVTFTRHMDVLDAVYELVTHRIGGAPVVDEAGNLIGVLSEYDCLQVTLNATYYGERGGPVENFMQPEVVTVDAEMSIVDLAQKFIDTRYRRYPVMEGNRLVGQISRRDVLRALETLSEG